MLFTRGTSPLSMIIRHLTGEPVSHCAILSQGVVVHFNLRGLQLESLEAFEKHAEIVYRVEVPNALLFDVVYAHWGKWYDFGGLLYSGLRCLLPFLPKANLWQTSGMFLCTEFVQDVVNEEQDHMITPYKLYLRLSNLPQGVPNE